MTYFHFENLIVIMIVFVYFKPYEFNHMTCSRFKNLIVIMIVFINF